MRIFKNLEVYYQPKFNIKTKQLYGVEALVRFKNIFGHFLNTEECLNSINNVIDAKKLTTLVINKIFSDFKGLEDSNIPNISVNISTIEIESDYFREWIEELFLNSRFKNKFEFEVIEKFKITNKYSFYKNINFLKELGFKVSLDDLGKDFNQLELVYIQYFNLIKLDKSFIAFAKNDFLQAKKIIKQIKIKNLMILAEGIENIKDFNIIESLNIDLVQGFYFSKPINYEDLIKNFLSLDVNRYNIKLLY